MQEEILIKASRTGTTVHFFNTDINENNYSISTIPAVIKLNSTKNIPIELNTFDGVSLIKNTESVSVEQNTFTVLWKRNTHQKNYNDSEARMDYVQDTLFPNLNYISGRTFTQIYDLPPSSLQTNSIRNRFLSSMETQFTAGTTSYVFFEETLLDDLYANIKLERTFDVLDTLNIYNKVSGEYSTRESTTGVVFGKLEAIQKISDTNGNKIRIPLRNVPVGIFVSSTDFQTVNDLDNEGNRIRLNFRPLKSTEDTYTTEYSSYYFNSESVSFDNQFLKRAPLDGINLHPTFVNVVYTNENGEFILHNIETGPQMLFFEVDLLKQGLTKDEVALNFFPYPPNFENISIDTIPHYFYRAIPIDVVPSWGDSFQTGYTEVNISINLDLRKWITYIFPPITYKGNPIDSSAYQEISRAPLTVQVRDMSRYDIKKLENAETISDKMEVYPSKRIQMVEIQNILDKNSEQQWEWANEFSQIKDKASFYTYGFHGIKLPANIYDDEGYKTNKFGEPQNSPYLRGVWLGGYQLKIFLTKETELYRTTGMALVSANNERGWYDRDHFHCSLYEEIYSLSINESSDNSNSAWGKGVNLNKFPYEKAWSKNYPEPYSIPKPPKIENFTNYYGIERPNLESPRFADGDLIPGHSWLDGGYNGWGISWMGGIEQYTDFATDVIGGAINTDMYRYEPIGAGQFGQNQYFGCYANGYFNGIDNFNGGVGATSTVLSAEKYQRLEAGYGYYLFPSSMPRLAPVPTGLIALLLTQVDLVNYPEVYNKGYSSIEDLTMSGWWNLIPKVNQYNSYSVLNRGKRISMDLSKKDIAQPLINDKLNIYRIIEGSSRVSYDTIQPVVPTYTYFIIEEFRFTVSRDENERVRPHHSDIIGSYNNEEYFVNLEIKNTGEAPLHITIYSNGDTDTSHTIEVGQSLVFFNGNYGSINPAAIRKSMINFSILAKGNYSYDETNNKYTKTSITFKVSAAWPGYGSGQKIHEIPIKDKCNVNCIFDATDSTRGSVYNANTIWRAVYIYYYENFDNYGWLKDTNSMRERDGDILNINGIFCNPGKQDNMAAYSDGTSYTYRNTDTTGRLNNGGAMELYWSKGQRHNPNGDWITGYPLVRIQYGAQWETPLCQLVDSQY
jgi:hypothetical protein